MARKYKIWGIVTGALVLVAMLAACGPSTSSGTSIKNGGSIINGLYEEPDTLLPNLTNETYSVIIDQALWAPLWYGDPTGQFHPGIAKEVPSAANGDASADLKTWTIKLKSGLKWSDGSPLTADDCAFSFTRYADPALANTAGFPTTDAADPTGFVSATATDPTTVVLKWKNPLVNTNALLADGVSSCIPKAVFGSISAADNAKSQQNFKPTVTSGPFMVSERVQGDHITLVKNPNYYQPGLPHLDKITVKIIPDQNTILTALQSGTIDESWFLDVTKLDSYKAISGYTTGSDSNPAGYEVLNFNLYSSMNNALADVKVRQALTMSFDPNVIVNQIYKGSAKLTCDDHPGTFAHEPNLTCNKQDVAGAGALLDQAGWAMGSDGYRHKNGATLELRYATTNKASRKATQVIAQAAWKAVGIKIDIKNYAANLYFGTQSTGILHSGAYDIGEFMNSGAYDPDDHTVYASDQTPDHGGGNYGHYSNPEVDAQEKIQVSSADQNARLAAFKIIHQDILKDVPVMYLYAPANIFVFKSTLHNYMPSAIGPSEWWNVWDFYVS